MHLSITLMESRKRDADEGNQLGRTKEKSERQEVESWPYAPKGTTRIE